MAAADAALVGVSVMNVPAQTLCAPGDTDTVGVGLIVMVSVDTGVPAQPAADGVTVIVATEGTDVLVLSPINVGMLPVPEAPRPIDGRLLVQV